ncbi:uncharacterized protein SPSK_05774 [Sporothrix schenckii 1099-18]|uniref:Uncharacterized protein n=1 Tax=Sporothrix schenckii 1099-18 TaxID=1397361 RepID=A0A0F2LVF3_SPOSC|nr:uncharacterized protein SPSK_05774 [Sporothrix schenckii 1099-18]KJR80465.1 hypothetical protein SPSK_05774 [Sporothrix schenckii 1099-18]
MAVSSFGYSARKTTCLGIVIPSSAMEASGQAPNQSMGRYTAGREYKHVRDLELIDIEMARIRKDNKARQA